MERPENIFSQRLKQAHLQFAQANAQTKNCKRACFSNRTDTAILDGQTTTDKEGRTHNKVLPQWGLPCFYETFVVKQTVVLLMKSSANNPPLRQYPKR